jgi:hypothetical protein
MAKVPELIFIRRALRSWLGQWRCYNGTWPWLFLFVFVSIGDIVIYTEYDYDQCFCWGD